MLKQPETQSLWDLVVEWRRADKEDRARRDGAMHVETEPRKR